MNKRMNLCSPSPPPLPSNLFSLVLRNHQLKGLRHRKVIQKVIFKQDLLALSPSGRYLICGNHGLC